MAVLQKINKGFSDFFTQPIATMPLGILRILISVFGLLQAILWHQDWGSFFGEEGYIQWEISQAFNQPWHVHMADVYSLLAPLGFSETIIVEAFFWVYVMSLLALGVGWYTRIWGILTWACHYVMMSSLPTFVYGVDIFYHIGLFYLMVMPVNKALSLDIWQGRVNNRPTWATTLSIRVLQLHLCLIYISAGFEKMLYANWWEGNVLWRSIVQPDFRQYNMEWLAWYPAIPMVLSWFTMVVETFYFAAMWVKKLRVFWLLSIIGLHIGIGIFIGLYLFSLVSICLSLSAFGYVCYHDAEEWWLARRSRKALTKDPLATTVIG